MSGIVRLGLKRKVNRQTKKGTTNPKSAAQRSGVVRVTLFHTERSAACQNSSGRIAEMCMKQRFEQI